MNMQPTSNEPNQVVKLYDMEWFSEVPRSIRKQTIFGLMLLATGFGGFGAWAFTAPLAAAVVAQGSFVATGQNKIVQHLEGGIIKQILVSEGSEVTEGQPIVRLDETAALATERQLQLRLARLEAINARLVAEHGGKEKIDFPKPLQEKRADPEIEAILQSQVLNFNGSRLKIQSEVQLLASNIDAFSHRAKGFGGQRLAMQRQLGFLRDEFAGKSKLFQQGLIRKTEINAMQRAMADAEGQIERLGAEVAETQAQIKKHEDQINQTMAAYRQAALDEMQSIEAELDSVREQSRNAQSILKRATINAPTDGTIVKMYYHTAGGVIESGKSIAEILPTGVPLIVEVQVPRSNIDNVRAGQNAVVRLTALNQRTTPVLNGKVFYVSADSLPDKQQGQLSEVYIARVSLPAAELKRVPGFSPTPGMPAEIMIQTAERTFMNYLAKPIVDSMSRAFREQ